jgi:hypothetical protein
VQYGILGILFRYGLFWALWSPRPYRICFSIKPKIPECDFVASLVSLRNLRHGIHCRTSRSTRSPVSRELALIYSTLWRFEGQTHAFHFLGGGSHNEGCIQERFTQANGTDGIPRKRRKYSCKLLHNFRRLMFHRKVEPYPQQRKHTFFNYSILDHEYVHVKTDVEPKLTSSLRESFFNNISIIETLRLDCSNGQKIRC